MKHSEHLEHTYRKHQINLSYSIITVGITDSEKLMKATDPWIHNSDIESNSWFKWRGGKERKKKKSQWRS